MLLKWITSIRHGSLKNFSCFWAILRPMYRGLIILFPKLNVSKKIGPYGPFKLNRRFAFSNFDAWGGNHNRGFEGCIEAARGMSCVLDIGAHIGLVTLPLSQAIVETGKVYAFEPATANQTYLVQHLASNLKNCSRGLSSENKPQSSIISLLKENLFPSWVQPISKVHFHCS